MFKFGLVFLSAIFLFTACATVEEAYTVSDTPTDDGRTVIDLVCNNSAGEYAACDKAASKACGGATYEVLHRENVFKEDRWGQTIKHREMKVACN